MNLKDATTEQLLARYDALEEFHVAAERSRGNVSDELSQRVFDGDHDPEYEWNNLWAIDRELGVRS